jgi:hypothetical protein
MAYGMVGRRMADSSSRGGRVDLESSDATIGGWWRSLLAGRQARGFGSQQRGGWRLVAWSPSWEAGVRLWRLVAGPGL